MVTGKNNLLLYFNAVYLWAYTMMAIGLYLQLSSVQRALYLMAAFLPILALHLFTAFKINALRTNRLFFGLTALWLSNILLFALDEWILPFHKEIWLTDYIAFFLFQIIGIMVSLSLILNYPFFLERKRSRLTFIFGLLGFLFFLFMMMLTIFFMVSPCSFFEK